MRNGDCAIIHGSNYKLVSEVMASTCIKDYHLISIPEDHPR